MNIGTPICFARRRVLIAVLLACLPVAAPGAAIMMPTIGGPPLLPRPKPMP